MVSGGSSRPVDGACPRPPDVLDTVFDVLVRDFSAGAVDLHGKRSSTEAQQRWALSAVRTPSTDPERFDRTWQVVSLS